jgi:hypothetical protein
MTIKIEPLYDILFKFGVTKMLVRLIKTCLMELRVKLE